MKYHAIRAEQNAGEKEKQWLFSGHSITTQTTTDNVYFLVAFYDR